MLGRPEAVSLYMLERPEAVSHYENAGRSVRERFALRKCRPQLQARESARFTKENGPSGDLACARDHPTPLAAA